MAPPGEHEADQETTNRLHVALNDLFGRATVGSVIIIEVGEQEKQLAGVLRLRPLEGEFTVATNDGDSITLSQTTADETYTSEPWTRGDIGMKLLHGGTIKDVPPSVAGKAKKKKRSGKKTAKKKKAAVKSERSDKK